MPSQQEVEIKKLLEENQQYLRAIYQQMEKTRRYIMVGRILSLVYLLIIIAPIILAFIYLPPLIESTVGPYKELLNISSSATGGAAASKAEINAGLVEQLQQLLGE